MLCKAIQYNVILNMYFFVNSFPSMYFVKLQNAQSACKTLRQTILSKVTQIKIIITLSGIVAHFTG